MSKIEEIAEFLQPAKSALILWDIQKMLVEAIFNRDEFLGNVRELTASARARNIPVIFSKITPLPERFESPARKFMRRNRPVNFMQTPGALDLVLPPEAEDLVINKNTASFFVGTNFELILRNAGLSTVVMTGIATEMGVESTAREAANRGFFPVIVGDAVSSRDKEAHSRSLENLKNLMPIVSTSDLVGFWKK